MRNYDKNIESLYLMYLDAKNLCGWAMSQKLPINGFKWVDVEYPKELFSSPKDLLFLPEREKNRKSKKICLCYRRQRKICHTHKSFKTSA